LRTIINITLAWSIVIHFRLARLLRPSAAGLAALTVMGLILSALAIAQALATASLFTGILDSRTFSELSTPLIVLAVALLARPVATGCRELAAHSAASRLKRSLRAQVLDHETARGPFSAQSERVGVRHALVVDGVENIEPYATRYVPQVVVTAVTAVVTISILTALDPVVGLAAALAAIVLPLVPRLWDSILSRRGNEHWSAYSSLHADVVDSVRGMETLKLLGAAERRRTELAAASRSVLSSTLRQLKLSLAESGITGFLLVAGPAITLTVGVGRVAAGDLDATALFAIALLSFEAFRPFRDLANHWHAGYLGVTAGSRLLSLLDHDAEPVPPRVATEPPPGVALLVSDARVRYPGAERPALDGCTFEIPTGSMTAIVGPSGSGKSTIANLVLGLLPLESGSVALATSGNRPAVSLVSQDPVLFSGTLRENLALVAPNSSEADMLNALHRAEADELASPDRGGLDAAVGEGGQLLSGGQRQRVALARALLRRSPLLLLDEATSALDANRERAVFARLRDVTRSDDPSTVIVVAHRLSAIRDVDRILVVDDGRVVAQGTYGELVEAGGLFARMHAAQAEQVGA